jgi:hypothetical protein
LEHGPSEENRIKGAVRRGKDAPPKHIAEAPELWLGLELYYIAWWDLTRERQVGFSLGPIAPSDVRDWSREWKLDEDQAEDLMYYMMAMDKAYMDFKVREAEAERKARKGSS